MKCADLEKEFDTFIGSCRVLLLAKNHDYAGTQDALQNLMACERLGICSAETGVLIRMCDKLSRLGQLVAQGKTAEVADEKAEDTAEDLANYSFLLHMLIVERKDQGAGNL